MVRAGKIVFILVATLEPSLNYLVAIFDNLVAKSTTDNIHIMVPGRMRIRCIICSCPIEPRNIMAYFRND